MASFILKDEDQADVNDIDERYESQINITDIMIVIGECIILSFILCAFNV